MDSDLDQESNKVTFEPNSFPSISSILFVVIRWKCLLGLSWVNISLLNVLQTTESPFVLCDINALNKCAAFLSQVIIPLYDMSWLMCQFG